MLANSGREEGALLITSSPTCLLRAVQEPGRGAYPSFSIDSMWLWQINSVLVGFLNITGIGWFPMQLRGLSFLCQAPFHRLLSWSSLLSLS